MPVTCVAAPAIHLLRTTGDVIAITVPTSASTSATASCASATVTDDRCKVSLVKVYDRYADAFYYERRRVCSRRF